MKKLILIFLCTSIYSLNTTGQCNHPDDIAGLSAIYDALNGPNWNINNDSDPNNDWIPNCSGCDLSQWEGISCDANGRVAGINTFGFTNVIGNFPNNSIVMDGVTGIDMKAHDLGVFPSNITSMFPNLYNLSMFNCNLSGTIPLEVFTLSSMEVLRLQQNSLEFDITQLSSTSSTNIHYMDLDYNNIYGTLQENFWTTTQNNATLELTANSITGSLPDPIGLPPGNAFWLRINQNGLTGGIPASYGDHPGSLLDFGYNNLSGCYDQNLNTVSSHPWGSISNGNCFNADWDDFIANGDGTCGTYPPGFFSALSEFYDLSNGDDWTNTMNDVDPWFSNCDPCGSQPGNDAWFGITCNSNGQIRSINMPNNNMVGTLPPSLCIFPALDFLNVNGDFNANTANLSGTIPEVSCTDDNGVVIFVLNFNNFSIGGNQFTGTIPTEFSDMSNLATFFVRQNMLSGSLPDFGPGNQLIDIKVDNNLFTGCYSHELYGLCDIGSNPTISDGNGFDATWDDFCSSGAGFCCEPDITIIADPIPSGFYSAEQSITINTTVNAGSTVVFDAPVIDIINPALINWTVTTLNVGCQ